MLCGPGESGYRYRGSNESIAGYFLFTKSIDANDIAGTFNNVVLSAKQHYAAMESPEPRYLYPDKNVPIDLAKQ